MKANAGGVYLVHIWGGYRHAGHYTGYAHDIDERITEHRASRGARLLQVVNTAGIEWEVVRVWMGAGRKWERILKGRGGARRMCPVCNPGNTRAVVQRKRKSRGNASLTQARSGAVALRSAHLQSTIQEQAQ